MQRVRYPLLKTKYSKFAFRPGSAKCEKFKVVEINVSIRPFGNMH